MTGSMNQCCMSRRGTRIAHTCQSHPHIDHQHSPYNTLSHCRPSSRCHICCMILLCPTLLGSSLSRSPCSWWQSDTHSSQLSMLYIPPTASSILSCMMCMLWLMNILYSSHSLSHIPYMYGQSYLSRNQISTICSNLWHCTSNTPGLQTSMSHTYPHSKSTQANSTCTWSHPCMLNTPLLMNCMTGISQYHCRIYSSSSIAGRLMSYHRMSTLALLTHNSNMFQLSSSCSILAYNLNSILCISRLSHLLSLPPSTSHRP